MGKWLAIVNTIRHLAPGPRQQVLQRLRTWAGMRLVAQGPMLAAMGAVLRDVLQMSGPCGMPCEGEEMALANEAAAQIIQELDEAWDTGELVEDSRPSTGIAIQDMAVRLATALDRTMESEHQPLNTTPGDDMDREEGTVGLKATAWLRARLPTDGRGRVYEKVLECLRDQLGQEAQHLRRLHMAMMGMEAMGIRDSNSARGSTDAANDTMGEMGDMEEEELHNSARMIVDDLIVWVAQGLSSKRSVLDMLRGEQGKRKPGEQGDHVEECQRLRRWLNELYENEVLFPDYLRMQPEHAAEEQDPDLEDMERDMPSKEELANHDDEEEEVFLMQRGAAGRRPRGDGHGGERTRDERGTRPVDRARDSRGITRTRKDEAGYDGGTGADGNAHRPWRRARTSTSSWMSAGPSRTTAGRGRSAEEGTPGVGMVNTSHLPENFRQHAWHCLLDMVDPMTSNPHGWSYGVPETSEGHITATFEDMSNAERLYMMVEFARVMSMILMDVADLVQEASGLGRSGSSTGPATSERDVVRVPVEEDDESGLVQTEVKRRRLLRASERKDVSPLLMDKQIDHLLANLISELEGLSSSMARQRAQLLYNRMAREFGSRLTEWSVEAEGAASVLITFGVEGYMDEEETADGSRFVHFWWTRLRQALPGRHGDAGGHFDHLKSAPVTIEIGDTQQDEVGDSPDELVQALEQAIDGWEADMGNVPCVEITTVTQLVSLMREATATAALPPCPTVSPGHTQSSIAEADMVAAAEEVERELREARSMDEEDRWSRRLRDWQGWAEERAIMRGCAPLEIRISARVRRGGLDNCAQTVSFSILPGDTVDLALTVTRAVDKGVVEAGLRMAPTTTMMPPGQAAVSSTAMAVVE